MNANILEEIAQQSPIARFATLIKESTDMEIAASILELQNAQAERNAATKKFADTKLLIAKMLTGLAMEAAVGKHQKLLLIDSFTSDDKEEERPQPLLEHLLANAIQEDKGEIVFRSVSVLVRTQDIQAIDPSLVTANGITDKLGEALLAIGKGKIPLFARAYHTDHCAITVGRINS